MGGPEEQRVRKSWVLAIAAAAMMSSGVAAEYRRPEPAQPPRSYVVASAKDSSVVAQAGRPAPAQQNPQLALRGTLPLLFVGTLLLGLAAAVRRTT